MTDKIYTDEKIIHDLDCYENLGYRSCGYAIDLINRQKAEIEGYRKQSGWISVDERLPDENGRFLTVDEKGDMMVCYWEEHFGWFAMVCNKNAITHWMPLPEPPDTKEG